MNFWRMDAIKKHKEYYSKKSYYPKGAFEDLLKHKFNNWSQDLEKMIIR